MVGFWASFRFLDGLGGGANGASPEFDVVCSYASRSCCTKSATVFNAFTSSDATVT